MTVRREGRSLRPLHPHRVTALAFDDFVNAPDSESDQLAVRARAWAERTRREQGLPVWLRRRSPPLGRVFACSG